LAPLVEANLKRWLDAYPGTRKYQATIEFIILGKKVITHLEILEYMNSNITVFSVLVSNMMRDSSRDVRETYIIAFPWKFLAFRNFVNEISPPDSRENPYGPSPRYRAVPRIIPIEDGTKIYKLGDQRKWVVRGNCPSRELDTVVVLEDVKRSIVQIIEDFRRSGTWYSKKQIPYRLSLLLHGPSGNGKTSLIMALSKRFRLNLYYLDLVKLAAGEINITDVFNAVPPGEIIVVEDLDFVVKNLTLSAASNKSWEHASGWVVSQLLHVMDGLLAHTKNIVIITSNNYDELPDEFKKAGRFDHTWELGNPDKEMIEKYFLWFYQPIDGTYEDHAELYSGPSLEEMEKMKRSFAEKIIPFSPSICEIQGHLLKFKTNPEVAIQQIEHHFTKK
jgi:chaperone BCS1